MWLIGLQMLIWAASGSYFALMNIHFIHGDHLVTASAEPLSADAFPLSLTELSQRYPNATGLRFTQVADTPVIQLLQDGQIHLLNPTNGAPLPPINEVMARRIAERAYQGTGTLIQARLLTGQAPSELSPRHLPAWRLDFSDAAETSLYVSQLSGEVVTKRHRYWRWFDDLWYLHIMDYESGENINNLLLRVASILALSATLFGALLLGYRLRSRS
ncbi:peptidase [Marinobacter hydrocarbonoclasticus]|nr:peptidase [Marinobacter nauticus]